MQHVHTFCIRRVIAAVKSNQLTVCRLCSVLANFTRRGCALSTSTPGWQASYGLMPAQQPLHQPQQQHINSHVLSWSIQLHKRAVQWLQMCMWQAYNQSMCEVQPAHQVSAAATPWHMPCGSKDASLDYNMHIQPSDRWQGGHIPRIDAMASKARPHLACSKTTHHQCIHCAATQSHSMLSDRAVWHKQQSLTKPVSSNCGDNTVTPHVWAIRHAMLQASCCLYKQL
jgi:hypothetical protein